MYAGGRVERERGATCARGNFRELWGWGGGVWAPILNLRAHLRKPGLGVPPLAAPAGQEESGQLTGVEQAGVRLVGGGERGQLACPGREAEVALVARVGLAVDAGHVEGEGLGQALAADAAVGHEELGRLAVEEQAGVRLQAG